MGLKEVKKLLRREAAPPTTGDAKPSSNFNAQTATTTSLFGRLWRQKNGKLGGKVQSQLSSSNEIPRKGTESEIRETAFQLQQRRRPSTTNLKQNLECPPVDKPADDGPSYKPSLWDRAYDTLRKDDAQLLEDYEALVSREVHSSDVDHVYDPQPQRPLRPTTATLNGSEQPRLQMQTIIDRGLRKAEDGMTTRGDSALGGTAQFLRSIKGFITQAVSASPEASVAWAAVCLVLPLFTNHFDAEEANHEGFTYSIHRMQYYSALEPLVFEQDGHLNPSLREAMEKSFVTLYKILLEFQIRTALRFSETTARTVLKETFLPDTWKELRASIDKAEAVLKQDLEQVNMAALLLEAKNQNELSKQQAVALEQLFPLGEAASQTAQTAKEQLQTEQAILTAVDEQTKFQQAEAQRKDQQKMSEQEMRCLQRLRLTDTDTYEVTKDRVDTHVEGTCQWVVRQQSFCQWMEQDSGPLLITADPGCGKSVLTKYLVDHHLPRELVTICYFFFKEPHQTKVTQALCAILHQLFANKSALFKKYAMDQLSKDPEGVVKTPSSLWDIFWRAVCDPGAGSITVVMDALDECDPSDLKVFLAPYLRKSIGETINTKFLFTTRPYESITVQFDHLQYVAPSYVRILGEDKCQEISKEVNLVIEHRVEEFAREKKLHTELKTKLREMLLKIEHRTYLWVALLFDDLRYQSLKKTAEGIETAIKTLPTSVNQAYEKLLSRSTEHVTVRRTLSYILAAKRPLTVAEMKVALNTRAGILPKDDDEPEEDFRDRLRQMCGLFISFYQDSVYFFHQTAREFLLTHHQVDNSAVISPDHFDTQWQSSISIFHAHAELGRTCVQFLDLLIKDDFWGFGQKEVTASTYTFYYYSRHNWSRHYRRSNGALDADAEFLTAVKSLCNPQTPGFLDFFNWGESGIPTQLFYRGKMDECVTPLRAAAMTGCNAVVSLTFAKGIDMETEQNRRYQESGEWPAVRLAAMMGHFDTACLVLSRLPSNAAYRIGLTGKFAFDPMYGDKNDWYEYGRLISSLLKNGFLNQPWSDGWVGRHLLEGLARRGTVEHIKMVLREFGRHAIEHQIYDLTHAVHEAVSEKRAAIIQLLLDYGDQIVEADAARSDSSPNAVTCQGSHTILRTLVARRTELHLAEVTALHLAISSGCLAIVQMLLSRGASIEALDGLGRPVLHHIAWGRDEDKTAMARLLLDGGANPDAADRTAPETSQASQVKLNQVQSSRVPDLDCFWHSEWGRNFRKGGNALHEAAAQRDTKKLMQLYLDRGVDVNAVDGDGLTALHYAVLYSGDAGGVEFLLENGAEVEAQDKKGRTSLHMAVNQRSLSSDQVFRDIISIWIGRGGNIDLPDNNGQTPLHWAARRDLPRAIFDLIRKGANIEATDEIGRTPLHAACEQGPWTDSIQVLVGSGANIEACDISGLTPLLVAVTGGNSEAAYLLLKKGANFEVILESFETIVTQLTVTLRRVYSGRVACMLHQLRTLRWCFEQAAAVQRSSGRFQVLIDQYVRNHENDLIDFAQHLDALRLAFPAEEFDSENVSEDKSGYEIWGNKICIRRTVEEYRRLFQIFAEHGANVEKLEKRTWEKYGVILPISWLYDEDTRFELSWV